MPHEKPTDAELLNRYGYHKPVGDQPSRFCAVRNAIIAAAKACRDVTPCCPEQTRAFNALDEAMFLFNASIARHEGSPVEAGHLDGTAGRAIVGGEFVPSNPATGCNIPGCTLLHK